MGKLISSSRIQQLTKIVASDHIGTIAGRGKPFPKSRVSYPAKAESGAWWDNKVNQQKKRKKNMESGEGGGQSEGNRVPLSLVVADCVKRWFRDTLKEAKAGDVSMQVLVGQMYYSGYGVPKDDHKGRVWIAKASQCRSSAMKVRNKRPGYNLSDSDSEDLPQES